MSPWLSTVVLERVRVEQGQKTEQEEGVIRYRGEPCIHGGQISMQSARDRSKMKVQLTEQHPPLGTGPRREPDAVNCCKSKIFFLWRPLLLDPMDDHVVEVAVAAKCESIVTHNAKNFRAAERMSIRIMTPAEYLAVPNKQRRKPPKDRRK